jgi:SPP1 gp7 family putative phage head morphogenesis protein
VLARRVAAHIAGELGLHDLQDAAGLRIDEEARIPKGDADYVNHSVNGERCDGCTMFRAPDGCTLVRGSISPWGHCKFWEAKLRKADDAERAAAILSGLDLGDWSVLVDPTADDLAEIYSDGIKRALPLVGFEDGTETINEAREKFGLPPVENGDDIPAIVNQTNERAVEWSRNHAAELVTQLEDNTRDMLRATVTDAIKEGWGAMELARELEDSAGFSQYRAELVGRTEVIAANNRGNLDAYKESGVATGKEWLTARDDLVEEICQANEDQGPIGLDDDFDSGDDCPPAHPNCRCAILPVTEPIDENG